MKQKPVAWIEEDGMVKFDVKWASQMQGKEPIPLYTEPQYRELSDEEIVESSILPLSLLIRSNQEITGGSLREAYLQSARKLLHFAILKKAMTK